MQFLLQVTPINRGRNGFPTQIHGPGSIQTDSHWRKRNSAEGKWIRHTACGVTAAWVPSLCTLWAPSLSPGPSVADSVTTSKRHHGCYGLFFRAILTWCQPAVITWDLQVITCELWVITWCLLVITWGLSVILVPTGHHLGPIGHHLVPTGHHLVPTGHHLGPIGHHLGPTGHHLGPSSHQCPRNQRLHSPGIFLPGIFSRMKFCQHILRIFKTKTQLAVSTSCEHSVWAESKYILKPQIPCILQITFCCCWCVCFFFIFGNA